MGLDPVDFDPPGYLKLEHALPTVFYLFYLPPSIRTGRTNGGFVAYSSSNEYVDLGDDPLSNVAAFKLLHPLVDKIVLRQNIRTLKRLETLLTADSVAASPLAPLACDPTGTKFPYLLQIDHLGRLGYSPAVSLLILQCTARD